MTACWLASLPIGLRRKRLLQGGLTRRGVAGESPSSSDLLGRLNAACMILPLLMQVAQYRSRE